LNKNVDDDLIYMLRAVELATGGIGFVEPNPPVGAIIVKDGEIIGEGHHEYFGGPHAEIKAISDASGRGRDTARAVMYVSLEPCCHTGKTPPCTRAIIESQVARVVVGMEDPDERVSGKGVGQLREAGVEVACGVCEAEVRDLLAPYIKLRTARRPWVICKWAQTLDGHLSMPDNRRWLTSEEARGHVHDTRGICDGILVGIETVLSDDPELTCRGEARRQPARIVLDSRLRIPSDCRLLRTVDISPVLVVTREVTGDNAAAARDLQNAGAELLELPGSKGGVDVEPLLDELGNRNHTRLYVEGGRRVLEMFTGLNLADELHVYTCPETVGDSDQPPGFDIKEVAGSRKYRLMESRKFGPDTFYRYVKSVPVA